MTANTLLLMCLGLPVIDLATRPNRQVQNQPDNRRLYSFEAARKDPVSFEIWWRHFTEEFFKCRTLIQMPDPNGRLPFRLKPNSEAPLFESLIHINHLGFRDEEFDRDKRGAYRIVALGESTTMGCTLKPEDIPWPKVLEQLIQQRLHPGRRVQVINAGVAAYSLVHNLIRLADDILPLQPDLIISYHGYNGFDLIDPSLPAVIGPRPPAFVDRPIFLLAQFEYRLKLRHFVRHYVTRRQDPGQLPVLKSRALQIPLADYYRQWIAAAQTNHVKLVLATFNLAVNSTSAPQVVAFYRQAFRYVDDLIWCNEIHNLVVEQLVKGQSGVYFADTRPKVDGAHEKFIDLVHFTQEGRDQLAANIFTAIRPILMQDLGLISAPDNSLKPK
jgi:lysophospholipase L1-like esterase